MIVSFCERGTQACNAKRTGQRVIVYTSFLEQRTNARNGSGPNVIDEVQGQLARQLAAILLSEQLA